MLAAALFLAAAPPKPAPRDPLRDGFLSPPASARPHTWWHWMDGNITKEGLTADLEAMKQVGIGGAQMFTVSQGIPRGPVDYMSPKWLELTGHAIREANRLGIELCMHNCDGWSSSGGPWIDPEHAMQVVAWSEVTVQGGQRVDLTLPPIKAPQVYANVPYSEDIVVYAMPKGSPERKPSDFLGKTGVVRQDGLQFSRSTEPGVDPTQILNISAFAQPDGRLKWDAPAGEWTILRIGHVPTGKDNHPATEPGRGLEVDKLSKEALDLHWNSSVGKVLAEAGPLAGKSFNNALIDSYEVGSQNWTPKMREEFQKRRGYDPLPFLPVICGKSVRGGEMDERFLWDWRRTIADLYADNYYGHFAELCHKAGIKFSTEPYGNGGFDNLEAGGKADIPMGEFWVGGGTLETTKIAASAGHIYGRKFIGAESFTADDVRGRFLEEPYAAKALGDFVFCNGVNRYIFHRYAHQPWMNLKPGMTMGPWGTHLERTQTWWIEAQEWMKYIARCQYLLQSGQFVGDALYWYGESAPVDLPYSSSLKPRLPFGYDYDGIATDALLNRLWVKNGRMILPNGASYGILFLADSNRMTPKVARRLKQLVAAGAVICGPKPTASPSLTNAGAADAEVKAIGDELWGAPETITPYGKGMVANGGSIRQILNAARIKADFSFTGAGVRLAYIHRRTLDADFYFVSNQGYRPATFQATFRVGGRRVELWHPDTGVTEEAPAYAASASSTSVPMRLGPAESVFVVLRGKPSPIAKSFGAATAAPVRVPVIKILSARYETADGRGTDVTDIVREMVARGDTEVPATNGVFGDPVVNVVKRLALSYTVDGKPFQRTVAENEVVVLMEAVTGPPASDFELKNDRGRLVLTAWKGGQYGGTLANGRQVKVNAPGAKAIDLSHKWVAEFAKNWGAPPFAPFENLTSWSESKDSGIKYFSGSAVYSRSVSVPKDFAGGQVRLDLGRVKNFATVTVNGHTFPALWKEPFSVDVSRYVRPGENSIAVKVTNLWVNRIIGDEQLPPDVEWDGVTLKGWPEWLAKGEPRPKTGRYTFSTWKFWNKDSPLLESGLLGPVTLRSAKPIVVR